MLAALLAQVVVTVRRALGVGNAGRQASAAYRGLPEVIAGLADVCKFHPALIYIPLEQAPQKNMLHKKKDDPSLHKTGCQRSLLVLCQTVVTRLDLSRALRVSNGINRACCQRNDKFYIPSRNRTINNERSR